MKPFKGWTEENCETYARYLAENYYVDEDGSTQPRRSEADAYEEWKPVAARLGLSLTGTIAFPESILKRAEEIREEMKKAEQLRSAAPDMARELLHLLRLMEPLEKEGGFDIPGLATLNGARAALRKGGVIS